MHSLSVVFCINYASFNEVSLISLATQPQDDMMSPQSSLYTTVLLNFCPWLEMESGQLFYFEMSTRNGNSLFNYVDENIEVGLGLSIFFRFVDIICKLLYVPLQT
jgi:hypothetical protein